MGLPTEIRCKILRLLLGRNKEVTYVDPNKHFDLYMIVPVDTRLFAVNRQMQADAEVVFFRSNTINVHVTHNYLSYFITSPRRSMQEIRKIHLWIEHEPKPLTQPLLASNLAKVADLLKECKFFLC